MAENGHSWGKKTKPVLPKNAKCATGKYVRYRRSRMTGQGRVNETVRQFVEDHRGHNGHDCIFVPAAQKDVPASVTFCGNQISAARYMCLLTHGAPKYEGAVTRHLCGNGHLSCVNPNHVVWGDTSDNVSDMVRHKKAGENIQDRIQAVSR